MFHNTPTLSDIALSNNDAANLILSGAIEQLSSVANITEEQSLTLLRQNVLSKNDDVPRPINQNIISDSESDFIMMLFKN